MPDVRLVINGTEYGGWKAVTITRSIETMAGSFTVSVSDRWTNQPFRWPIREEDACRIEVDRVPLITGFIDSVTREYDDTSRTFSVTGRDKSAALIDNSVDLGQWQFSGIGVLELARKVAKPFGVEVSLQDGIKDTAVSTSNAKGAGRKLTAAMPNGIGKAGRSTSAAINMPNESFKAAPGDSAFDILNQACRIVGVLPVSDGLGGLVLTRAGGTRATTALERGVNILKASATFDGTKRYHTYKVKSQSANAGDLFGDAPATATAAVTGTATDANVRRTDRVLIVPASGSVTAAFARRRAEWEATTRAARAIDYAVTVQGWFQADGTLWPLGGLVSVTDLFSGISGDMLIASLTLSLSDAGTTTQFKLMPPKAFTPEPVIVKPAAGSAGEYSSILGNP